MFDTLTQGFRNAALKLKGQTLLTESNIGPALDEVRRSLLEADVDYDVVKQFLVDVKAKALGNVVQTKAKTQDMEVGAGDHFVKLCHDEILGLLGGDEKQPELQRNPKGPTVILLVGLQGAGKTTHAAKLAKLMRERHKMRPLLVAADVYRPAARDQLKALGERLDVPVFTLDTQDAVEIATQGLAHARAEWLDLVIIDTAGRLAIDETLMTELERIKAVVQPQNILLVIDAMIGQDAVRTASAFDERLGLSGVVLTKLDGDTRGGAALSVKRVTGKNILFIGTGEAADKLEEFRPDGMASRILGMGDIVGLMDDFSKVIDEEAAEKSAAKLMEGQMDFDDFLQMMQSLSKMGPLKDVIAKTPIAGQVSQEDLSKLDDREVVRTTAMVQSMTRQERQNPDLLINRSPTARSRIGRIARGSGRNEREVRDLVDKFMQMRQMMQMMMGGLGGLGGGLLGRIPGLGGLSQAANMAKMMRKAQGMGGGLGGMGGLDPFAAMGGGGAFGGMPGMPGLPGMGAAGMKGAGISTADLAELNRLKKKKKEEKKARAKNRR